MTAFDFFLYCAGASALLLSTGATVRMVRRARLPVQTGAPEHREPVDAVDGLAARLQAFQQARYASPIVRRELPDAAVPFRRGAPRTLHKAGAAAPALLRKKEG